MNYFDQLLESYSRLKSRKLVLLEKESTAIKTDKEKEKEKIKDQDNKAALDLLTNDFNAADAEYVESEDEAAQIATPPAPYYWKAEVNTNTKLGQAIATNLRATGGLGEKPDDQEAAKTPPTKPIVVKVKYTTHQAQGRTVEDLKNFYPRVYQELLNYYMSEQDPDVVDAAAGADLTALQNMPGKKLKQAVLAALPEEEGWSDEVQATLDRIAAAMTKLLASAKGISTMAQRAGVKEYFAGWVTKPERRAQASGEILQQGSGGYTSPNAVDTYIVGDQGQSISRIIREGATARIDPEIGLDFIDIARDPAFIADALDSVIALIDLGGPETPADSKARCLELSRKVMRKGNQLVFITSPGAEGQAQGLVMPKNHKLLTYAAKQAMKRCGGEGKLSEIEEISYKYDANELNAVRGPAFETGIVGASIFGSIIDEEDEQMKEAVSNDLVGWMNEELNQDSKKFTAAMAKIRRFRDLDAAEDIQGAALTELFEDFDRLTNTPAKFRAFFELVTNLREIQQDKMDIGADMAFPVAKEKGVGYSDDTINLFRDKKKAEAGATKLGLEDGSEEITIGELRKKDPVLTAIYENMFFPQGHVDPKTGKEERGAPDNTIIYRVGEGVKAYKGRGQRKIGEVGRLERRSDVVMKAGKIAPQGTEKTTYIDEDGVVRQKKKGDPKEYYDGKTEYLLEEYNPGTAQAVWKRLWGADPKDQEAGLESAQRYQTDVLDTIKEEIDTLLPSDMGVVIDKNNNIVELTYDNFESEMEDRIANLSFTSEMRLTLQTIFHDGKLKKNLKDKNVRLKAREELTRLLINAKQHSDMKYDGTDAARIQERIDAKNNLAYTVQMFGGVKHDSTITSMTIETEKSILVTSHMKTVNKYTKGLLDTEKKGYDPKKKGAVHLELAGDGYSINIVDTQNPKRDLTIGTYRSGKTKEAANSGTAFNISSAALEEFATVNEVIEEKGKEDGDLEDSLMVAYLRGQHHLLETLLATQ
jgi:hypothetical protein